MVGEDKLETGVTLTMMLFPDMVVSIVQVRVPVVTAVSWQSARSTTLATVLV